LARLLKRIGFLENLKIIKKMSKSCLANFENIFFLTSKFASKKLKMQKKLKILVGKKRADYFRVYTSFLENQVLWKFGFREKKIS